MNYFELLDYSLIDSSKLMKRIWIIIFVSLFLIVCIIFNENSIYISGIMFLIICLLFFVKLTFEAYTQEKIIKSIKCITTTEIKQISFLPYQYVNQDTYTFLIDEKEFYTIKTDDIIYKKDSVDSPYIVVEKVTYKVTSPKKWYIDEEGIEYVNNEIYYFLKEVHY